MEPCRGQLNMSGALSFTNTPPEEQHAQWENTSLPNRVTVIGSLNCQANSRHCSMAPVFIMVGDCLFWNQMEKQPGLLIKATL